MMEKFIFSAQKDAVFWIFVFISFLLIVHFFHRLISPKKRSRPLPERTTQKQDSNALNIGQIGESAVFQALSRTQDSPKKIINDIVLKTSADKTAQIDHILINKAGIFVIETKNYKGRIYGAPNRMYWCQYLGNKKYTFYNPMKQNKAHIKRLKEVLGEEYPYYSVVVFAQNNISHMGIENVINLQDLTEYIQAHDKKVLTKKEIKQVFKKLNRIQKKKHDHIFWSDDHAA